MDLRKNLVAHPLYKTPIEGQADIGTGSLHFVDLLYSMYLVMLKNVKCIEIYECSTIWQWLYKSITCARMWILHILVIKSVQKTLLFVLLPRYSASFQLLLISDYEVTKDVRSYVGSITDRELVMQACEGVDTVIHVASLIDWRLFPDQNKLHHVNVKGI